MHFFITDNYFCCQEADESYFAKCKGKMSFFTLGKNFQLTFINDPHEKPKD
jgi:hypothetical protein